MAEEKIVFQFDGERTMEISTGKVAKLANGSCLVRLGDTIVLTAACSGAPREGTDFFPLQVDYREKYSAAGKFPGGYIKREGRPSTKEILTCRMIDRPIRPLFPDYFFDEVQISSVLLSADGVNEPDVLAMVGASASLMLSDLPFQGPIGAVRVGLIDGKYVINPTRAQMEQSKLELIYAGRPGQVIMIEGEAEFVSEQQMKEAMYAADKAICKQCEAQIELAKKAGRPKKQYKLYPVPEALKKALETFCADRIEGVCTIPGKEDRMNAMDALRDDARKALRADFADMDDNQFALETAKGFDDLVRTVTRNVILTKQFRPDGRSITEIRPLSAEVGVLPVVHGSALFSRGETQALVLATLGNEKDAQEYDDLTSETGIAKKRFYLHYNFPNFSVGEVGRITGPGRREIGHGNLAERSVSKVVPKDFPYVVRCVSEIMSSNGSTSMASVCGATLALMDAGVPIKAPVAGISCGLIQDGDDFTTFIDIQGVEDFHGEMDFKVAGTKKGITAIQMDLKNDGLTMAIIKNALEITYDARVQILDQIMLPCISEPRAEVSQYAPKMITMHIDPERIREVIGKGGSVIQKIVADTGAKVDIDDDGTIHIASANAAACDAAKKCIDDIVFVPEVGKLYYGRVVRLMQFGAFVEIAPGKDGLVHISKLDRKRVEKVEDVVTVGDMIWVKFMEIDEKGRWNLSRKDALIEIEAQQAAAKAAEQQ